jgi:hypothetical protein
VTEEGALTIDCVLNEFSDVFGPITGTIKNFQANVSLKDDAVPKFLKARPIPYALSAKVDEELEKMESMGVLTKVEHSQWASPLVVVPKSGGRIRITGDFKHTVNHQLNVTQYPLASPDVLFNSVSGGETFSKLDGPDAFHQIPLNEESKKFLVVNTPRGLYQYNVLPMGIASAPAIFQQFMDRMLHGIPMAGAFMDDCICSGRSEQEHLHTLRQVLQRMREANYKLGKAKCEFLRKSVKFLGFVLSGDGRHTDPQKVEAIMEISAPNNAKDLSSFLGLVNFYRSFVPRFSDLCEPLYRLTQQDVEWNWTELCQRIFEEVKSTLSSSEVLATYDMSRPIGISCDASPVGLGAVLFHKYPDGTERPICYASRTLSPAERRYPQIEREALGIYFGCSKFYQYLCGNKFTLVTDHEPFLCIFGPNKQVPSFTASRIHKWSQYLSQFRFDVVYRNTKLHGNADALSRLPVGHAEPDELESEVHMVASSCLGQVPVTSTKIRKFTSRDKVVSLVFRHMMDGWPKIVKKEDAIYPYFLHRNELTIMQGIILWGLRVVIPTGLRKELLAELHAGHFGIVRMKSLARQFVWWPGIDKDITTLALNCHSCRESSPNPPAAPLHPWEFPEKPWQRLHVDLAGPFFNKMWLVLMDAHSKWPEVYPLARDSTSTTVITHIRDCISRFGIPEQIVSDNGTQFTSREFQAFCKGNGINHSTSSVYHPRSNGEAERLVATFKASMTKAGSKDWELSLHRFLLTYRITPHATTGSAPCELLQGRKLRCLLDLVRPSPVSNVAHSQQRQEANFNKNARQRDFRVGQRVWVKTYAKNLPRWSLGTITAQRGPLTFVVSIGNNNYRRHIDQILDAGEERSISTSEDDSVIPTPEKAGGAPQNGPGAAWRAPSPARPPKQSPVPQPSESEDEVSEYSSAPPSPTRSRKQSPVPLSSESEDEATPQNSPTPPSSSDYEDHAEVQQIPRRGKRKRVQRKFYQAQ